MAAWKMRGTSMADDRPLLLGCGILHKEIRLLIEKNNWPLDTFFVDSILHVDFGALAASLQSALARNAGRRNIVFYGACHPLMERMLHQAGTFRTEGQNCVEMLLGAERFGEELAGGAYFLLEDWALRWEQMINRTFGPNPMIVRDIFCACHSGLLCLRTPCSGDFKAAAENASRQAGLPLRWLDVTLDNLESVLHRALDRRLGSD